MTQGLSKHQWFSPIFQPSTDFYALLNQQAAKTVEGLEALGAWLDEGVVDERCQRVRDLEKEADEIRLDLERTLVESFVTPFDREDIYDLSAWLDQVINSAKATVREIEALEISPQDPYLKSMAEILIEGTRCLALSFASLKHNRKEASDQAALSRKSENRFAKVYRQATRQLFALDDIKLVMKTMEVYRYMLQGAEAIDIVGEKLLHVIIKMS